jgi:predicted DNA binding CopG/RHH family protein
MTKQNKRIVPAFATEAEEADWWYKNRNIHDKQLLAAPRSGEAKIFTKTKEELLRRIEASKKRPAPVVALRIPAEDLALARKQAGQKGLPYQARDACQARKAKGEIGRQWGPRLNQSRRAAWPDIISHAIPGRSGGFQLWPSARYASMSLFNRSLTIVSNGTRSARLKSFGGFT